MSAPAISVGAFRRVSPAVAQHWHRCRAELSPVVLVYTGLKYGTVIVDLDPIYPLALTEADADGAAELVKARMVPGSELTYSVRRLRVTRIPIAAARELASELATWLEGRVPTGVAAVAARRALWVDDVMPSAAGVRS